MASMISNSPRATEVSVYVVRAFVQLREVLASHRDLAQKLAELEETSGALPMRHDTFAHNIRVQLKQAFDAIRELMGPVETVKKRPIGFVTPEETPAKPKTIKAKREH
jgi:hypothetical protein